MYNVLSPEKRNAIWLLYLRKSRQDDPTESVEETLLKHEIRLQDWALHELGRKIPEEDIYREIVSGGENLDAREELQKVLTRLEDQRVAGVLVIDPQRLTRGTLEDCGRLMSILVYSRSMVATPSRVYDLSDKMQRQYFEDELMRGRYYLDYAKEKMWDGRVLAARRGLYLAKEPPFGYRKIVIGKDHTLEPDDNADFVRMIFDWYVNHGMTFLQIARKLDDMGVKPLKSDKWNKTTIRHMLKNLHYDGKVSLNRVKEVTIVEHGRLVKRRVNQPPENWIVAEGRHEALVDHDLFVMAQEKLAENPPVKTTFPLKNPFAGILYCAKCGKAIAQHPYKHAEHRFECRTLPRCYKSVKMSEVKDAILLALETAELPNLQAKWRSGEGASIAIQKKLLAKLEKEMENYHAMEEAQYDYLESGRYTPDVFDKRNAVLRQKMEDCQERIYKARSTMPKEVNYQEKIITLKNAIEGLKSDQLTPEEQNKLLKAIVQRIDMKTEDNGHNAVGIKLAVYLRL